MRNSCFAIVLLGLVPLAVGCAPTRTAGTENLPKDQLAVLTIRQNNSPPGTQINAVKFDNGARYEISGNRDFYLLPGDHPIAIGYGQRMYGPEGWFNPTADLTWFAPLGTSTGVLQAGKHYGLKGWADGISTITDYQHGVAEELGD